MAPGKPRSKFSSRNRPGQVFGRKLLKTGNQRSANWQSSASWNLRSKKGTKRNFHWLCGVADGIWPLRERLLQTVHHVDPSLADQSLWRSRILQLPAAPRCLEARISSTFNLQLSVQKS